MKGLYKILEEFKCTICFGIVKLPALMCTTCSKAICEKSCYEKMDNKNCPMKCKEGLI